VARACQFAVDLAVPHLKWLNSWRASPLKWRGATSTESEAVATEADVLRWWRTGLGLPSYLRSDQLPQGGWTETVAAARIDLAATVARACEMALRPGSRPATEGA
jgi:hypothetical protein